jgi:hypothetical protein
MSKLVLNTDELDQLVKFSVDSVRMNMKKHEDDMWFGFSMEHGRTFDVNIYTVQDSGELACTAYECFENSEGLYSTDMDNETFLWVMVDCRGNYD